MSNFFGESYDANLPPFLPRNHSNIPNIFSYPLPFGLQNSESVLKKALAVVSRTGFNATRRKQCLRCVVVGNGGILSKTSLGNTIDEHDVIFRLNDAPTAGYEEDVGSKTTLRMAYPESSFQNRDLYRDHWLYVVILFKPSDGEWLVDVASGKTVRSSLHFWKSVAKSLPKPADEFRIFNPLILREAATMIGFDISSGKMNKNVPTTGSLAISMATRLCDEVSVAGFGYREDKPLHYYDKSKASDMKKSWTHNIDKEKQWLQKLVVQGVIQDLTGGIVKM
ncbi:CMP-N-acetylneuraminate-beta-1,4-galactoside alpha-2,3-sialyltransferase-like [Diadema setosum]|uniref:CMP-N-acetylneuraminate-beta-1,4-galactoside alpha-2,3-sialyltransferase-like n=1 Tax=Diadema setosum TaxID=31175 RepID=UPI003B3AD8E7